MFSLKKLGTAAALLVAATTVNGQAIPGCAQPCVGSLLGGQGGGPCGPSDGTCICGNKQLINDLACCVLGSCDPDEQEATRKFAQNICGIFKVPGAIPSALSDVQCPSGSGSAASSTPTINNISSILAPGPVLTQPTSGYTSPATLVVPSAYGGSVSINTAEYASQASANSAMASSSSAMQTTSSPMQTGSQSSQSSSTPTPTSSAPAMQSTGVAARRELGAAGALVAAVGGLAAMF